MMNEVLNYLYGLERRGIKVGLDHTKILLEKIGNPHDLIPSIHVAGTNGKGSTCAIISSILREAGLKVGLYTSPHLINFNERIRVNGIPISNNTIIKFVKSNKKYFDEIPVTFFEATTAMAFWYFNELKVDVSVVEVGLGGRLDSTNVIKPSVSVITSISIDHQHILGDSIESIAKEKGGIIKKNIPVVLGPNTRNVKKIFEGICKKNKSPYFSIKTPMIQNICLDKMKSYFTIDQTSFVLPMVGEHQVGNAAIAVKTVEIFKNSITRHTILRGLKKTIWPGRLQKLSNKYPVFYDVGHNEEGIKVIIRIIKEYYKIKPIGIFCLKSDKGIELIINQIKNNFLKLITVSSDNTYLYSSIELNNKIKKFDVLSISERNLKTAINNIRGKFDLEIPVIIFGSHYIAKDVFKVFDFSFDAGII